MILFHSDEIELHQLKIVLRSFYCPHNPNERTTGVLGDLLTDLDITEHLVSLRQSLMALDGLTQNAQEEFLRDEEQFLHLAGTACILLQSGHLSCTRKNPGYSASSMCLAVLVLFLPAQRSKYWSCWCVEPPTGLSSSPRVPAHLPGSPPALEPVMTYWSSLYF